MDDSLSTFKVQIAVFAIICFCLLHSSTASSRLPDSLQWAGRRDEIFSLTRAYLRGFFAGSEVIKDGYVKFNQKGKPFVLLDHAYRARVMLPQEYLAWLTEQPNDVLSQRVAQEKQFPTHYFITESHENFVGLLLLVIRRDLTRNLARIQSDVFDELHDSIDATIGMDEESWREISLFPALQSIIYRATNRVLLGSPLCRDEKYLHAIDSLTVWLGFAVVLLGQIVPPLFRPILAFFFKIPYLVYKIRCFKFLVPLLQNRLENIRRKMADPSIEYDEPNDLVTWLSRAVIDRDETTTVTPEGMANHIIFTSIAAVQTLIGNANDTILDILSSPPELEYYQTLREEAAAVFKTDQDWRDSNSLAKLTYADSTIRESLRFHPSLTQGLMREVMPQGGITLPDGQHLPQGTWVGVSVVGIHMDDRFYSNANHYDPFRFIKPGVGRAESAPAPIGEKNQPKIGIPSEERKNLGLSTASDIFLVFGYGAHACPGRWIAANILKLLLAYLTLHYDMQPLDKPVIHRAFGDLLISPRSTTIKVRRRKGVSIR